MPGTERIPPYSPEALRELLRKHGLSGSKAGRLLRVDPRTIRRWCGGPGDHGRTPMPAAVWLLLLILVGEVSVAAVRELAAASRSASSIAPAALSK